MEHIYQWHHGSSSSWADKLCVYETSGTQWFHLPHMGNFFGWILLTMVYCITYDCSNKDADKKRLSFFRFPKDHKLRLTWFKKLRLVDPPNTDNVRVCSKQFPQECFVVDMQAAMEYNKTQKEAWRNMLRQLYFLSLSWLSQECFLKDEQKCWKKTVWWHLILIHC